MSWSDHLNKITSGITGALFEEDTKPQPSTTTVKSIAVTQNVIPSPAVAQTVAPLQLSEHSHTTDNIPEFLTKLRAELGTSDIITKYESTLSALESTIPDEATRVKTALIVLSTTAGIQSSHLLEAYKSHVSLLETESTEFAAVIDKRYSEEVSARHTQAASISDQLESKKAEIEKLTQQYKSVTGEIAAQKNKLDAARAGFNAAIEIVRAETEATLNKLTSLTSKAATNTK